MLQVKLLRVLQDGVFERVGDNVTRRTDARIIVATNRKLTDLVENGEFREDLYYRINVISIEMPPLRERKGDIGILVDHFFGIYVKRNDKNITDVADDVRKMFEGYHWPGNIRELENAIEGGIIMAKSDRIEKWDVPNLQKFSGNSIEKRSSLDGKPLREVMQEPEREMVIAALEENDWNRNKAASSLGINRTTLYNKMKKYKIAFRKGR